MNIYKRLLNNSLIFAVGNLGTKLLVLLLVPLYTYYLSKEEFGTVDLLTTTLSFLIPIFTLSVFDSVLRFAMDKNCDKKSVLSNSLVVTLIGFIVLCCLYPLFTFLLPFEGFVSYFYSLLFLQSITTIFTQYIRALGKIKLFAWSGILNAFALLICNLIFLVLFHMGIIGYFISLIIANIITIIFVVMVGKVVQDLSVKKINIKLTKEMLVYSIPLIPNALMWWIMGLSDRFIITYYLGLGANGLYAVANKIPSVLNIINSIFFQAWQIAAIEEANSKDKSKFFSNVFNIFSIVMLTSTSIILVFLKLIVVVMVSASYNDVWKYVPFLLLGVVFSSFSGFLGTNYIAAKKTGGVFKTSVIGAIINIVANLTLIPLLGINGASIGTLLSFAVIWILRIRDTKKFVNLQISIKKLALTFTVIGIQIGILYINLKLEYILQIILLAVIILINLSDINMIIKAALKTVSKKTKNYRRVSEK
ncbi:polysaccharide biosynthesis protein [Priestia megaterium]|uniref:lipopolysaccharide biosynthesis protein n=1 Tax=Priestia megaterium TaxID=1404 RepID=UPI000BFCF53F|nr:oligosaccharide flippase family protein [Priestia megaterium]PGT51024.1 polysaccharide biosynthesis protein [Priestia megaterium]